MQTSQTQIKLNLPVPLKMLLSTKAERFGVPMASYIRHLIIQDVDEIPTHQASQLTEKTYKKALKEKSQAIKVVGDMGQFLDTA